MPGETVVPASATRTGWKTSLALTPRVLDHAAQGLLDVLGVERLDALERRAGVGQGVATAVGEPLLARRGVVGRAVEDEARQRPEVRQGLDLLLGDGDRVVQARSGR